MKTQEEIKAEQSQFITSGGARVKVDYYIPDPKNPDRPVRATLPAESVDWLIKQLSTQGSAQDQLASLGESVVGEIAGKFNQQQGAQMAPQMPPMPPPIPRQGMTGRRMQ